MFAIMAVYENVYTQLTFVRTLQVQSQVLTRIKSVTNWEFQDQPTFNRILQRKLEFLKVVDLIQIKQEKGYPIGSDDISSELKLKIASFQMVD